MTLRKFVFIDEKKTKLQLTIFADINVLDAPDSPDEHKYKLRVPAYAAPEVYKYDFSDF